MRKIFTVFLFLPLILFAQKQQDSIQIELLKKTVIDLETTTSKVDSFSSIIKELNSKYEYQLKINEQTLNSISNQIGASSYSITIFGILFGIAALVIGVYVTFIERKIVNLKEENQSLLSQTLAVKKDVVEINDKIQSDIYGLFLKIKREETVHILQRLLKVPKDIANLENELLSRDLLKEDFKTFKEAYLKLNDDDDFDYKQLYRVLFFHHFLDLALKDEELSQDIIGEFKYAISCAFENDIIKSTEDFMKVIIDLGYQKKSFEINSYIKGVSTSKFKKTKEIYLIMLRSLVNRDDQFKFFTLIDDTKECEIGKSIYGTNLIEIYANDVLSDSEKLVKKKTESLIAKLEKIN